MHVLGISGSLRRGSYNSALLRVAIESAPQGMQIETGRIDDLPLYDEDVRLAGYPPPAQRLREQIARADAVLIVTPEYNYSIPGGLKNAIDWASRPPDQPFNEKPIALMGASISMLGSARAQYHLRQCFVYLNSYVLNQPEVMVAKAQERFDEQGKLTDDKTREIVGKQLQALLQFVPRIGKKA
jgi:chromate reductase, NAD(P)H dehydrogenase (quinone)